MAKERVITYINNSFARNKTQTALRSITNETRAHAILSYLLDIAYATRCMFRGDGKPQNSNVVKMKSLRFLLIVLTQELLWDITMSLWI